MTLEADSFGGRMGDGKQLPDGSGLFLEMVVAASFCVRRSELHGSSRGSATAAFARQVAIYLSHTRLGLALSALARHYGLATEAQGACSRRIMHWGADDYRPNLG